MMSVDSSGRPASYDPAITPDSHPRPGCWTATNTRTADVVPDDVSRFPAISANGAWVDYASRATNLVPGDTNGVGDVFVARSAR